MSGPDPSAEAVARAMEELWRRFRSTALERVGVLERAGEALAAGGLDAALAEEARAEAHKLVGSLGSFGLPAGTALAREAERLLRRGPEPADASRLRGIAARLRALVETADPSAA